jgi:hypothetical protein
VSSRTSRPEDGLFAKEEESIYGHLNRGVVDFFAEHRREFGAQLSDHPLKGRGSMLPSTSRYREPLPLKNDYLVLDRA